MAGMSPSDQVPLPRLGEVFFDVRGESRSMRLSWYGAAGVAVFSIWQADTCTGTFRLRIDDLPRMLESLRRGPRGQGTTAQGGAGRPAGVSPRAALPAAGRRAAPRADRELPADDLPAAGGDPEETRAMPGRLPAGAGPVGAVGRGRPPAGAGYPAEAGGPGWDTGAPAYRGGPAGGYAERPEAYGDSGDDEFGAGDADGYPASAAAYQPDPPAEDYGYRTGGHAAGFPGGHPASFPPDSPGPEPGGEPYAAAEFAADYVGDDSGSYPVADTGDQFGQETPGGYYPPRFPRHYDDTDGELAPSYGEPAPYPGGEPPEAGYNGPDQQLYDEPDAPSGGYPAGYPGDGPGGYPEPEPAAYVEDEAGYPDERTPPGRLYVAPPRASSDDLPPAGAVRRSAGRRAAAAEPNAFPYGGPPTRRPSPKRGRPAGGH